MNFGNTYINWLNENTECGRYTPTHIWAGADDQDMDRLQLPIKYIQATPNVPTWQLTTITVTCIPVASVGASGAVLVEAGALLESSREWIQLEAPCRKSRSRSAVSLLTRLSVLTFSTCFSVCGPLPGEEDIKEGSKCTKWIKVFVILQ